MLNELLYQNANIYQVIDLKEDYGQTITTKLLKYNTNCRKNLKQVTKKLANGKIKILPNTFKIYVEDDLDIVEHDLIILDSTFYDVLHVYKVFDYNKFHHIEILVKVVDTWIDQNYWLFENGEIHRAETCNNSYEYFIFE
jgi:hypothetical protein